MSRTTSDSATSVFTWPTGSVNSTLAKAFKPDSYFTYHLVRPLKILHAAHRMHISVLYGSKKKKGIISPLMSCIPLCLVFNSFTQLVSPSKQRIHDKQVQVSTDMRSSSGCKSVAYTLKMTACRLKHVAV
jgi:hypothetical protein